MQSARRPSPSPIAALLLAVLALAGCYKTVNHGRGECHEYQPLCLGAHERCTTDDRGCETCTCDDRSDDPSSRRGSLPEPEVHPDH